MTYTVVNPSTERSFTFQVGLGPWQPATIEPEQAMSNVVLGPNQLRALMAMGLTVIEEKPPSHTVRKPKRIKVTLHKPKT